MIYVVATPIGNLTDITARAVEVLRSVDRIAAEDTRHSGQLLKHLQINKPLIALHDYNEREQCVRLLDAGGDIALISDAGTPLISDPGYHLVRLAHERGVQVVPIPGPCALIAALSASGLPTDRFCFEGFLSAKQHARLESLHALQSEPRTMVFYEAPHRIVETLQDMLTVFGAARHVVLARELTKQFETIKYANLQQLLDFVVADANQQRGEFVLVVAGCVAEKTALNPEALRVLEILLTELSVKQAAALAAKITGISKNILYDHAVAQKGA